MRKLRYTILILCLLPQLVAAQRRFSAAERWEYSLAGKSGFTSNDVNNSTDILFGLHASQYTGSHHLIGISTEGSWTSFVSNMPAAKVAPGGVGAGLHLLYEYQYSGFILQTGFGAGYQRVYTNVADTNIYHPNMLDTWSGVNPVRFTLKHHFTERQDMSQQFYGQFQLLAGHYLWAPKGVGYFLAGLRANYAFWGTTETKATGTTSGFYEDYVGVYVQMPNHGFRQDVPIARKGDALKLKVDVMAHAEIGYEYTSAQNRHNYRIVPNSRADYRIRIGAFANFGILNICPGTDKTLYDLPTATIYDFPTYKMEHLFSTADAKQFWMRNLFVGVRLTFLFGFQGKEHCILCDPWRH